MKHDIFVVIYFVVMAGIIVSTDFLFLREHFWLRLGTNVAIVLVFALVYLTWLRNAFR
ncbi:hypothetical protein [Microbacterium gorillae]|uniref:hypothetical protein n=1 Tax=Microbacterium gorillae TaxID=1231063 RepID=UPI000A58A260|nr:hypothetical protein [Microbacterium gorillae]